MGTDDAKTGMLTVTDFDTLVHAANDRFTATNHQARHETRELQALVERKQHLIVRLERTLAELQAEQGNIALEDSRLLTPEEQFLVFAQPSPDEKHDTSETKSKLWFLLWLLRGFQNRRRSPDRG